MRTKITYLLAAIVMVVGLAGVAAPARAETAARPIVYTNGLDGHVISVKPDGSDRHDVGPGFYPTLSPDGTKVAFSRDTADFTARDLFVANLDGSGLTKVAEHVYTPGSTAQFFTWSPDGAKLTFTIESGTFNPHTGSAYKQIATARANGTDLVQLTHDDASINNINPVWSPDGSKILYNHNADLYMMNADGTNQHMVVGGAVNGSWSPDSTKIVFLEVGVGIRTANIDGTGRMTLSGVGSNPRWSPDGNKIVMEAPECGCNTQQPSIVVANPDGSDKKVIAAPPTLGTVQHPVWSPDSTKVAFVEFASWEPARLVTVPAEGGDATVVIVERVGYPEWSYLAPKTVPPTPQPGNVAITVSLGANVQATIQASVSGQLPALPTVQQITDFFHQFFW